MGEIRIEFKEDNYCISCSVGDSSFERQKTLYAASLYYKNLIEIMKRMSEEGRVVEAHILPKPMNSAIIDRTGYSPPSPAPPSADELEARKQNFWPFSL